MDGQMISDAQGSRPVPDPTILTTEQLMREISRLEETVRLHVDGVETRLQGEINLTTERFEAMRRALDERYATQQFAIQIAATTAEKAAEGSRQLVESKLEAEIGLTTERFRSQREHSALVLTNSEKALLAAIAASDKAIEKSAAATERRFDTVNEFRGQLSDMQSTLISRAEADARIGALEARVGDLKSAIDKGFTGVDVRHDTGTESRLEFRDAKAESRSGIAIAVAVGSLVVTAILMIVTAMHLH